MRIITLWFYFFVLLCNTTYLIATFNKKLIPPKITVIMVIDQFAHHHLAKLNPFLHQGLRTLLDQGIVYDRAYHAHGFPETAPGHCSLNTGVLPKDHGIVGNQWLSRTGKKKQAVTDTFASCKDFSVNGTWQTPGNSPHNILVDGLSDQFCLRSVKSAAKKAFSLSCKARAAIGTANKLGKAIWFDDVHGNFTSSTFYFNELPRWVTKFNEQSGINKLTSVSWNSYYPESSIAYDFPFIRDYEHTVKQEPLAPSTHIAIDRQEKVPYEWYSKTPQANKHLLDLGLACIDANVSKTNDDSLLLWMCLSPLDFAGHIFGPDSFEIVDMIYHLDFQLAWFMKKITDRYGKNNVLFVLTADHGVQPLPEISYKKGITSARRIATQQLIEKMNNFVLEKYTIASLVIGHECSSFILDKIKKEMIPHETLVAILQDLKNMLNDEPGIKRTWTKQELEEAVFEPHALERFYKNSHHYKRTGDLICMPEPYCLLTPYKHGASHATPYDYDTHIPLILYQHSKLMKKNITEQVFATQLAGTLAYLHNIQRPSASSEQLLPGLFKQYK